MSARRARRGAGGRVALAALAALGLAGCCSCLGSPTFTVRRGPALAPPPPPALSGAPLRLLHLADFGDTTCQQDAVAAAVAAAHRRAPFDAALFPGDLVYDCGPSLGTPGAAGCAFAPDGNTVAAGFAAPADPGYAKHEGPLAFLAGVPVWVGLGNHDVYGDGRCGGGVAQPAAGRLKACLDVAHASPLWTMPGRHHVEDLERDGARARFIFVDSNLVKGDYGGFSFDDEVAFVAAAAAGCADRACFLLGHHPPVTAGGHASDATPAYLARMDRLIAAGGGRVRAWLAGHDHDLQHLRTRNGLDVLVSGNGARARPSERFETATAGATSYFGSVRWGYAVLEIHADGWRYAFRGDDGAALYCCAATGSGRCEPTRCP